MGEQERERGRIRQRQLDGGWRNLGGGEHELRGGENAFRSSQQQQQQEAGFVRGTLIQDKSQVQ